MKYKGLFLPKERTFLCYPMGAVVNPLEYSEYSLEIPNKKVGVCTRSLYWKEGFGLRLENETAFINHVYPYNQKYGGPNLLREKFE